MSAKDRPNLVINDNFILNVPVISFWGFCFFKEAVNI